jgi:uncharacterized protein (DUF2062 family)
MNLRKWWQEHSLKLLAIRDTPQAIAGGIAIGIFFGFTPLFGLKTVGAIFFAWVTRSNILAAVLATTLHDLLLPLMPFIYVWEYQIGHWILNGEWPQRIPRMHLSLREWRNWITFLTSTVGKPMLVGSVICGLPMALVSMIVSKGIVARHQRKRLLAASAPPREGTIPKD